MKRYKVTCKKTIFLFLVALTFVSVLFHSGTAKADTNVTINNHGPQTDSGTTGGGDFTPVTGVGNGSFNGQYSWYKIYVPNGLATTITVDQVCADLGSPNVYYKLFSLDDNEKYDSLTGYFGPVPQNNEYESTWRSGGSCSNNLSWPIKGGSESAQYGVPSKLPHHDNFRAFAILAKINPSPGSNERYFRVSADDGSVKVGLSTKDFTSDWQLQYSTAYKPSAGQWDYEVMFAPQCKYKSNNQESISIYDPDNGIYQPNMHAYLERSSRYGPINWTTIKNYSAAQVQGGSSGVSGTTSDPLKFDASAGYIYKFHIVDAQYPNTIQVNLPFDQIDASYDNCWKLVSGTTVTKRTLGPGDTATFHHSIQNTGPVAASYTWKIERKYVRADGTVQSDWSQIGGNGANSTKDGDDSDCNPPNNPGLPTVGIGNYCPNRISSPGGSGNNADSLHTYQFPAGAQPGDKYCQSIFFTNKNGPDDPGPSTPEDPGQPTRYSSTAKCVFYSTLPVPSEYKATCEVTVESNFPGAPTGGVLAGTAPLRFKVKLTNVGDTEMDASKFGVGFYNGNLFGSDGDGGYDWGATPRNNFVFYTPSADPSADHSPIDPDEGRDYSFTMPHAPSGLESHTIIFSPFNVGANPKQALGPNGPPPAPGAPYYCNSTVKTYQEFSIDPTAQIHDTDSEEPATVNYKTYGDKQFGPDTNTNAHSWLTKQPSGGSAGTVKGVDTTNHTYGNSSTTTDEFSYPNPTITPGDSFCAHVTIDNAHGWLGPDGVINGAPRTGDSGCLNVVNEPYVHFLGSDVMAGGGFGDNCVIDNGGIYTYLKQTGSGTNLPRGSGVQIGALAINAIDGFSSAMLRGSDPKGSTGLSFANSANVDPGTGPGNPHEGGHLGGASRCLEDYYGGKSKDITDDTGSSSLNLATLSGENTKSYNPGGNGTGTLTINSSSPIAPGTKTAIYVKGDVHITSNIEYGSIDGSSANWGTIENVPSLRLIVYGGKVTIDNNVTQLDGLYVSQPNGNNGGSIYTCEISTYSAVLDNCRNQLVVNGAFVAKQVFLLRSFGSLRNSSPGERLINAIKTCASYTGTADTSRGDCAAEIFNFSPELYLSQFGGDPGGTPTTGPTKGTYDYITSLSPVL
jgi:hypothetical protein